MRFQNRSAGNKPLVSALDIRTSGNAWKFTSRAGTQIRNVILEKSNKELGKGQGWIQTSQEDNFTHEDKKYKEVIVLPVVQMKEIYL